MPHSYRTTFSTSWRVGDVVVKLRVVHNCRLQYLESPAQDSRINCKTWILGFSTSPTCPFLSQTGRPRDLELVEIKSTSDCCWNWIGMTFCGFPFYVHTTWFLYSQAIPDLAILLQMWMHIMHSWFLHSFYCPAICPNVSKHRVVHDPDVLQQGIRAESELMRLDFHASTIRNQWSHTSSSLARYQIDVSFIYQQAPNQIIYHDDKDQCKRLILLLEFNSRMHPQSKHQTHEIIA